MSSEDGKPVPISCWPPPSTSVPQPITTWPPPPSSASSATISPPKAAKRRRTATTPLMNRRDAHAWPEIAIARAIRNKTLLSAPECGGAATSVHTKIASCISSPEGQLFLRARVEQLSAYVAAAASASAGAGVGGDSLALAVLGATQLCVGTVDEAVVALDQAVEQQQAIRGSDDDDGDADDDSNDYIDPATFGSMCSRRFRAHQQQAAMQIQQKRTAALTPLLASCSAEGDVGGGAAAAVLQMPAAAAVARVDGATLTREQFYEQYACKGVPVVLTGVVNNGMTSAKWTLEHIAKVAGKRPVTVKRLVPSSVEWAQLEDAETTTVAAFIDTVLDVTAKQKEEEATNAAESKATAGKAVDPNRQQQQHEEQQQRYLFDWSLPLFAPELAAELSVPTFFGPKVDMLKQMPEGAKYRDSWPSLFVAPEGLRSELHVDTFGSNFWMALFQGRKRWLFFDKGDVPLLYPSYVHSNDPTFAVDLGAPDLSTFPLLALTTPLECTLEAGELLFVPHGCPHRVVNMEQSLAVSGNFVDGSNFEAAVAALKVAGLEDPDALALAKSLEQHKHKQEQEQ